MYKAIIVIGVAVVICLAAGCGGDSGDGTATAVTLTKPQFIEQTDQACEKVMKKRDAAGKQWRKEHPGELTTARLDEGFEEVLVPSIREQMKAIETLSPPAADTSKIERMIDNLIKANRAIEKEGLEGLEGSAVFRFETEARNYGFEVCPRVL